MLKILYTQEPNGEVLFADAYLNERKRTYDWLLDQGYEIVGEA